MWVSKCSVSGQKLSRVYDTRPHIWVTLVTTNAVRLILYGSYAKFHNNYYRNLVTIGFGVDISKLSAVVMIAVNCGLVSLNSIFTNTNTTNLNCFTTLFNRFDMGVKQEEIVDVAWERGLHTIGGPSALLKLNSHFTGQHCANSSITYFGCHSQSHFTMFS